MATALRAPWQDKPDKHPKPRDAYRRGVWAYAYGKSAKSHPKYDAAVKIAKRDKWGPWWIRSWSDVEATLAGCYFDQDAGLEVVEFFSHLKHSKGRWGGHKFELADWQHYDIVMPLFGWKREDGTRRFRRAYIEIPKKNGKTTLSSGLTLYLLMYDGEPGAEVYSAAVDREQAGMVYQAASAMVKQSSELSASLRCIDSRKRIVYQEANAFYAALSADVASKEGLNIHGAIFDELHVYPNSQMWDTLKYGGAARRQPLQIAITTAGVYDPTSLGWEQHDYALKVRDAQVDAYKDWAQFAYVAGLDETEEDDWTNPKLWEKANPSWGITIREDEMAELCQVAVNQPSAVNDFKRYRLNIWTAQLNAWMNQAEWDACAGGYGESDLQGLTCYAGLDCSLSEDISALVLWFPPQQSLLKHRFLVWCWVPEERVSKCDAEYNGLYSVWIREGRLLTTPGPTIRQESIREKLNELAGRFSIRTVGYDRAFAQRLADDLESDGFDIGAFGQGFPAMNEPTTEFMKLVLQREMEHPNHPIMNWHVGNAQAVKDGGDRLRIVKNWGAGTQKARVRFKVDALIAAIMALGTSRLDQYPLDATSEIVWI